MSHSLIFKQSSSLDELLDKARLTEMKAAICLFHVNTEEVLQSVALGDDVLLLQRGAQVVNEAIVTSCHRKVIDMDTEHDLPTISKTAIEQTAIVERSCVSRLLEKAGQGVVESFWRSTQAIESLAQLPNRGLAINIRQQILWQLHVDGLIYVGSNEGAIDIEATHLEAMLSSEREHQIDGLVVDRRTEEIPRDIHFLKITQHDEPCLPLAGALSLQVHLALKDLMTTRDVSPENWLIAVKIFWAKKLHLSVDSWLPCFPFRT
jgi:hypothetical protein